jgi:dipeptidyl aminopeptidase/acylaminoacyl peptidase
VLIERSDMELRGWDWAVPGPVPAAAVTDIGATAGRPELLVAGLGLDGSSLRRVSPDGWRVETIDTGGLIPSWADQSADGSVIAFSARVAYNPAAAAPHPAPPGGRQRAEHLTVEDILTLTDLPEDRPEIGEEQIFVIRDGVVTQVTDPWIEDWRVGVGPDDHRGNTDPTLSPDGRTVVVANRSAVASESFLLRIDLQTGAVLNLTNGTAGAQRVDDNFPEISPDGSRVALDTASGTDFRSVTDDAFFNTMPTWSPDGRSIAYVSNRNYTEEELFDSVVYGDGEIPLDGWVIVRHDLTNGAETHLTTADQSPTLFPSWSPDGSMVAYIGGGPGLTDVDVVRADGGGSVEGFVDTPTVVETSVDWE